MKYLNDSVELYNKNNKNKLIFKNKKKVKCIIIGANAFKEKLSFDNQEKFGDLFRTGKDLGIINYIFIDTNDKLNTLGFDDWYKENNSSTDAIWLGNGLSDQYAINVSNRLEEMDKDIPYNFCFVIRKGKASYVKFIEQI